MIQEQVDRIEKKIDKLDNLLTGNGEPHKGIVVRLDRVEQREESRNKWTWIVLGASITALIKSFWASLFHGGS